MADRANYSPMATAPRDGTLIQLLIDYSAEEADHPLEDTAEPAWTIGHSNFDNDEDDRWQFAGWCWTHDHYTEGRGTPIGWRPWRPSKDAHQSGITAAEEVIALFEATAPSWGNIHSWEEQLRLAKARAASADRASSLGVQRKFAIEAAARLIDAADEMGRLLRAIAP